jgi:tetratricopeptide (TPR) repeat protein
LRGLPLKALYVNSSRVSDLSPLRDLPLEELFVERTEVRDLSPLRRLRLKILNCDFEPSRDAVAIRSIRTLQTVNGKSMEELWKRVDPKIVEAADCLVRGWDLAAAGKWDDARAEFQKAVDARPDDPQVWRWRGQIHAEANRFDEAAADFNKALELAPRDSRTWWTKAGIDDAFCSWNDVFVRIAPMRPIDANLWIARARWFAQRGKWQEAAKASAKVIELNPNDSWNWFMDAPLRLQIDDLKGYHRDCQEMLNRFTPSERPQRDDQVAKTCLLRPDAVEDLGPLGLLAGNSPPGLQNESQHLWYAVCRGLYEYRHGKFDDSIAMARNVLDAKPDHAARDATVLVIRAMAEAARGKPDEARAAFKDAGARIDANMPKVERGELLGDNWHDWLRCQILLREAQKLIGKDAADSKL